MQKIIEYLVVEYDPNTIIVYGSFADGTNTAVSDFDAMIIADGDFNAHNGRVVDGVLLDVFIYKTSDFAAEIRPADFTRIFDGNIVLDKSGVGARLKNDVLKYIENCPKKTLAENTFQVEWCEKMLARARTTDAEGYYRRHWLLHDSLEIYFDICGQYFYGSKKALAFMEKSDPSAKLIYENALCDFRIETLEEWVGVLRGGLGR